MLVKWPTYTDLSSVKGKKPSVKEIKKLATCSEKREMLTGLWAVQKEALHLGNTKSRKFTFLFCIYFLNVIPIPGDRKEEKLSLQTVVATCLSQHQHKPMTFHYSSPQNATSCARTLGF